MLKFGAFDLTLAKGTATKVLIAIEASQLTSAGNASQPDDLKFDASVGNSLVA